MPRLNKVRLTCDVTPAVKEDLRALGRSIQHTKGALTKAIQRCLENAYAAPDATIREFAGHETETCSIEVTPEEIAALHDYQDHHKLGEQRKGYKSALLRGLSIHLDKKERGGSAKKTAAKSGQGAPKLPL